MLLFLFPDPVSLGRFFDHLLLLLLLLHPLLLFYLLSFWLHRANANRETAQD
jgi:hypothetical protein